MLRFWLDRGVDGFRINSVAFLYENPDLDDDPFNDLACDPGDPNVSSRSVAQISDLQCGSGQAGADVFL